MGKLVGPNGYTWQENVQNCHIATNIAFPTGFVLVGFVRKCPLKLLLFLVFVNTPNLTSSFFSFSVVVERNNKSVVDKLSLVGSFYVCFYGLELVTFKSVSAL